MKYLFINGVSGFGSTGRLVEETCRELMAQGHECRVAYGRWDLGTGNAPEIRIGTDWNRKFHGIESRLLDNHAFSSRLATAKFLRWVKSYDPDVIWLHNLHGYYIHVGMLFDYLKTSGKTIRWTLHDCWAFTGHCSHFTYAQCDRWKTGCHHCPEKKEYPTSLLLDNSRYNYIRKKEAFTGVPNLTLIVPSNWLRDLVKQSFLREYPVEVQYHQIDPDIFHPVESDFRQRYGIGEKTMILSVANIWDDRKGCGDLIELSKHLDDSYRLVLIGLNEEQKKHLTGNMIGLSRTANLRELVEAYSAADVYVTASVEETFGMTILEAAACGTKIVAYTGTACEEVAKIYGGIAVPRGVENLLAGIHKILEESKERSDEA